MLKHLLDIMGMLKHRLSLLNLVDILTIFILLLRVIWWRATLKYRLLLLLFFLVGSSSEDNSSSDDAQFPWYEEPPRLLQPFRLSSPDATIGCDFYLRGRSRLPPQWNYLWERLRPRAGRLIERLPCFCCSLDCSRLACDGRASD